MRYCRLHKGRVQFVVVFNLTRFAREKYDHFALRAHLKSLGISLRSATELIDDPSTGKLMEGVLAAFAQFDNDVRSDRTRAGMRSALELGRWVFLAPLGYMNAPRAMGKSLILDPERAPLVRRAFQDLRLVKNRVLHAWREMKADAKQRVVEVERKQKAIHERLDRLDEAFLYERTIDIDTYDRHRDKLGEELTLAQMDRHATELEEMDVEGILAFAERVLPSASNLWVQSSLAQKQRLQHVFFPEGVRFDGKRLVGTGTTLPVFNYLSSVSAQKKELVDQTGIEPVTS